MSHKLGLHWLREHPDRDDLPHVERMQYRSVKLFGNAWDNASFCRELLAVLPRDAYILTRDHPLSEEKDYMWRDPEGAGRHHADQWAEKVRDGRYTLPTDRTFFLGINEPDATKGDRSAIDRYTTAYLDRLAEHGLRGGAWSFSTGHPRTVDGTKHTKADYTVFEGSHQAVVRGHHIGVLHIYGTGAVPCAPGHYDRLRACPWQDVQWVVGEFGIDEHVVGGGPHYGYQHYYAGDLSGYCMWLDEAIRGIGDPRIHSYQVFTYDFSHPWESFDVRPIRAALERFPWAHAAQAEQPETVYIPVVNAPVVNQPEPDNRWERSYAFVRRWEGGLSLDPNDPGNWYDGRLIGTKYGISAAVWGGMYDIPNLTEQQAEAIYRQHYWQASGADKLPWPLCLFHFDTAVNAGVGRAREMLNDSGGDPWAYMGHLLVWYTRIPSFERFGKAWVRRRAELLLEATA